MKKFSDHIGCVICTYNRKILVDKCIGSLLRQTFKLGKIIVVDNNSQDGTFSFLKEKYKFNSTVEIIKLKTNLGSAGAFHIGIKKAIKKNCDWIWLMDDDAEPLPNALEELTKFFYLKQSNVLGFASLVVEDGKPLNNRGFLDLDNFWPLLFKPVNYKDYENKKFIEIDFAASIGLLIAKELIKNAGLPNKKLFIYGDDTEWMIRIKKYGKIILVLNSIVKHNSGYPPKFKKFLWKRYTIVPIQQFNRYYFAYRNLIAIGRRYHTNHFKFYMGFCWNFLKLFIGIILFNDYKIKRFLVLLKAIKDGLCFNLDL